MTPTVPGKGLHPSFSVHLLQLLSVNKHQLVMSLALENQVQILYKP